MTAEFEGRRLLNEHTVPAMRRAIRANHNQIFSPKEMRVILAVVAEAESLRPAPPLKEGPR